VLRYDHPKDDEARELQETIRAEGERSALARYAGIDEDHPLVDLVVEGPRQTLPTRQEGEPGAGP
jgi:hypothetical protein